MKCYGLIAVLLLTIASSIFAQDQNNQNQNQNSQNQKPEMTGDKQAKGHKQLYCDPINISFGQVITSGNLKQINANKNIYRLTISDVNPYILYYTKRPKRLSGQVSLKNFLKAWNKGENSFKNNPPNAILYPGMINQSANRSGDAFRLIISKPHYQAEKSKMTYLVRPLGNSSLLMQEMNLNYSVLFIH